MIVDVDCGTVLVPVSLSKMLRVGKLLVGELTKLHRPQLCALDSVPPASVVSDISDVNDADVKDESVHKKSIALFHQFVGELLSGVEQCCAVFTEENRLDGVILFDEEKFCALKSRSSIEVDKNKNSLQPVQDCGFVRMLLRSQCFSEYVSSCASHNW